MIIKAGVEQENPFMPTWYENLSPDLMAWQQIRRSYTRFPTQESLDRATAIKLASATLTREEGLIADLLIVGSLAFGQSTVDSDIDVAAVVVMDKDTKGEEVIQKFQGQVKREIGKEVKFDTLGDYLFPSEYLEDELDYFDLLGPDNCTLPGYIRALYVRHYMSIGVGDCRIAVIDRIEALRSACPIIEEDLRRNYLFLYHGAYEVSLNKYLSRLNVHPDFAKLSEEERSKLTGDIESQQSQFLLLL